MPDSRRDLDGDVLSPLALKDGTVVHISEVERTARAGFVCARCSQRMVPVLGMERTHHFRHYVKSSCTGSAESALHRMAKEIFKAHDHMVVPPPIVRLDEYEQLVTDARIVSYSAVRPERRLGKELRPDVLLVRPGKSTPLVVEIFYRHQVDEVKLQRLRKVKYPAIEIDVSSICDWESIDRQALEDLIIRSDDPSKKRWLYIPGEERILADFEKRKREHAEALEAAAAAQRARAEEEARLARIAQRERIRSALEQARDTPGDRDARSHTSRHVLSNYNTAPFVSYALANEHLFTCDRSTWQRRILQRYVFIRNDCGSVSENTNPIRMTLEVPEVERWVLRRLKHLLIPEMRDGEETSHMLAELLADYFDCLEGAGLLRSLRTGMRHLSVYEVVDTSHER